ncbi:MAG TPA: peptidyl-prolyl cis-trans isomerase [Solirubrobacterales bacterium]|nr:peptidyl-prolyl cis-trans isomerase [Solirubrobacterales bacterium]
MGAKAGQRGRSGRGPGRDDRSAGRQRLALILFGALLVLLFAGFAIAQGLTGPSVPSGDAAHISNVPDEFANISQEKLKRATIRQATSGEEKAKKPPKPGTDKYEELQGKALTELIEGVWIRGEGEEMGVAVTPKQVEDELETIKKQNFPTPAAYKKFLAESQFTQEEVDQLVELQILTKEIQEEVSNQAPKPSSAEIEAYYEAEKETQFTTKESRDVRLILNEDKGEAEAAKKALEKDSSPDNWKKVAKKYSSDPTSAAKGGLQEGITEEFLQGPLKAAIFDSPTGELVGPINYQKNWVITEVVKLTPAKVQDLAEVKAQIESTLGQQTQQEYLSEFVADFESKWSQRTVCASGFEIEKCGNFKGNGHPKNASPACFEADPKTPATECPSPVTPISPALPGTVSETKRKGEQFPQRPLPESSGSEEGSTELPPGVTPEGGAPAEAPPAETGE